MGGVVGLLVLLGVGVPAVVVGLAAAPASALSVRTVMGRILVPMLVGIEPGRGRAGGNITAVNIYEINAN
ncbi:hypothetical protein HMPREF9997_01614 [Corynebacterium durum F0235]|uniref:Uncharacterized protein n=1 Tax=Corynebacterium durum F0235 TaxID=1035195 RepID=L1MG37_9CORY|nr:hypothetical protein HMPREF9997_01614 [Corynebacterium durum F0235]